VNLADRLRSMGVDVVEVDGWETRTNRGLDREETVGVVMHWDAIRGWPGPDFYVDRNRFRGVLYHVVVDRGGRAWLLSQRVVWHAGRGDPDVLDDLRGGSADRDGATSTVSGNRSLVGVAINHLPGAGAAPDVQVEAMVRVAAAMCAHFGLNPAQVIDHRRWTPRKDDIRDSGLPDLDEVRARVADIIDVSRRGEFMFVWRDDPDTPAKRRIVEFWQRQFLRLDPTLPFGPDGPDGAWGVWSDRLEDAIRRHAAPATGVGIGPGEADRILAAVRNAESPDVGVLAVRVAEHTSILSRIVAGLRSAAGG